MRRSRHAHVDEEKMKAHRLVVKKRNEEVAKEVAAYMKRQRGDAR